MIEYKRKPKIPFSPAKDQRKRTTDLVYLSRRSTNMTPLACVLFSFFMLNTLHQAGKYYTCSKSKQSQISSSIIQHLCQAFKKNQISSWVHLFFNWWRTKGDEIGRRWRQKYSNANKTRNMQSTQFSGFIGEILISQETTILGNFYHQSLQ